MDEGIEDSYDRQREEVLISGAVTRLYWLGMQGRLSTNLLHLGSAPVLDGNSWLVGGDMCGRGAPLSSQSSGRRNRRE